MNNETKHTSNKAKQLRWKKPKDKYAGYVATTNNKRVKGYIHKGSDEYDHGMYRFHLKFLSVSQSPFMYPTQQAAKDACQDVFEEAVRELLK